MGVEPVVADGLNREAVMNAVRSARPDAVVHEMTAIPPAPEFRNLDRTFATTNKLRTTGAEYLLEAARAAGALRFVAQSYTGWPNQRKGGRVKTERDPLDANPPESMRESLAAILRLEQLVRDAAPMIGVVLRYGGFYGPGTFLSRDGSATQTVRDRKFPIFGAGTGVWSFIHIDDAAEATRIAIERAPAGIYNIVDDDPAEVSIWLPEFAKAIGAKPPMHLPMWLGRMLGGEGLMSMMNQIRGSSNALAKATLGWQPRYKSWRDGFRRGL